jgi:hypothetical protein
VSRGTGRTTQQILDAPHEAMFVWVHGAIGYPLRLAHKLGRDDLRIVGPDYFGAPGFTGGIPPAIVVDHAVRFTDRQWAGYERAVAMVEQHRE